MRSILLLIAFYGFLCLFCATSTTASPEPYWSWRNPYPQGNDYQAVAYGGGRFVAVGAAGTITTSTDGITWSAAASGLNTHLSSVAYGNGRFVVVGAQVPGVLVSDDGLAWTLHSSVPDGWSRVTTVTYAGDRFHAMSNQGFTATINLNFVATSIDGISWTQSPSASAANVGRIAFNGGAYIGQNMTTGILQSSDGITWPVIEAKMLRSTDGVTWMAGGGTGLAAISAGPVYFDGRWVVGGTLVTQQSGGAQQFLRALSTSTDGGLTWTVAWRESTATSSGNAIFDGLAAFRGRLFLTGWVNDPVTSTADFVTMRQDITAAIQPKSFATSADRIVVVGRYGQINSSADGVSWSSPTSNTVTGHLRAAAFGNGHWIAAGDAGLAASPDGITWRMLPGTTVYDAGSVAFGNGRFVASASDGRIGVSTDAGATWVESGKRAALLHIAFAQAVFVGTKGLISSTDGLTWSAEIPVPGGTGVWTGVYAIDDVFYAVGTTDPNQEKNYVIARSVDGLAWTTVATMPERLASIGGADGLVVACGYMGEVWTSTDGVTWSQVGGRPLLAFGPMASLLWVGDSLVGTTLSGSVVLSPDGITWTKDEFASSGTMFAMAAGNGQILAVGAGGVIWEVGAARFTRQPESRTVEVGESVTLSVAATGKEPLDYQWEKNGAPIAGAKTKSYALAFARSQDEGNYSVTVSNSVGSTRSKTVALAVKVSAAEPPPPPPTTQARFANIATRAHATTGNGVTIGGFVIRGSSAKEVLIRAVGPSLTTQGIGAAEVLEDPIIELHHGANTLATNDNWGDNLNAAAITTTAARVGARPLDPGDLRSAAMLMTLNPGVYTFIAKGRNNTSGITLLEVYDADSGGSSFINIASRVRCTTNNGVAIGGFVIAGNKAKQVLLRAVGPTLTTQGLGQSEVLLDPTMELHHGSVTLASNDNWGDNDNAAAIVSVGAQIGATPFASGDTRSSALLMTLEPGVYSFIVRGKGDSSGIVLVEVYDAN